MVDNKTDFLQLPLPNKDNELNKDIFRIIQSFNSLDQFLKEKFSSAQPLDDWNKALELGYYFGNNALNAPETDQDFFGLVISEQNSLIQILYSLSGARIFWRTCSKNNFSTWLELPSAISSEFSSNNNFTAVSTALLTQVMHAMNDIIEYNYQTIEQSLLVQNQNINKITPKVGTMLFSYADLLDEYLLCNGAAISRTSYSALFSVIGTKFGVGDGSTSFNLPDMRGKVLQGANNDHGAYKNAGLPNITGRLYTKSNPTFPTVIWQQDQVGSLFQSANLGGFFSFISTASYGGADVNFDASRSSQIYGSSTTVQPPALALNCFIKY